MPVMFLKRIVDQIVEEIKTDLARDTKELSYL